MARWKNDDESMRRGETISEYWRNVSRKFEKKNIYQYYRFFPDYSWRALLVLIANPTPYPSSPVGLLDKLSVCVCVSVCVKG